MLVHKLFAKHDGDVEDAFDALINWREILRSIGESVRYRYCYLELGELGCQPRFEA
eukprot:m.229579 g.229579  ORF g.229579 m.229579 type:complete len:56 (+) comp40047_c0_seq3:286-453(+)